MKKPMKRNRKRLLKSVLDYLKSDSYMFSPLISYHFRVSKMKKRMKRRNKRLFKAVLDYLKSDTYLFAPLFSPPPCCSTEPKSEMKEASRGDSSGMLTNVVDYLKSDSFMYSPLVAPQPVSSSPIESSHHVKKIAVGVSTMKLTSNNSQLTYQSANEVTANMFSKENVSETSILVQQSSRQRESVKHIVPHSCCSSTPVSGKRILRSQLRKLAVD